MVLSAVQLIAHRGASTYAPENTLAAFDKAEEMGAMCIEFDVMLSADGEAFVFHDERLNRTTNGRGLFNDTPADVIRTLDAGAWFSRAYRHTPIPSFREALAWFADRDICPNIEIKPAPGRAQETAMVVLNQLNRHWPRGKPLPLISSFDEAVLRFCADMMPELPLGLLLDAWDEHVLTTLKAFHCVSIGLARAITTSSRVSLLKEQGYRVLVYTVSKQRDARRFFEWGVDAVFSDDPRLLEDRGIRRFYKKFLDKKGRVA